MGGIRMGRGLALAVAAALLLGACGDTPKKAAKWLRSYTNSNPPERGWKVVSIEVDDDANVVMDIRIPLYEVLPVKARPLMERALVVRQACPPMDAKIWRILEEDQKLWINLTSQTETITGTYCQRAGEGS